MTLMQEHDIARRPEWVQNVVSALVEGQAWAAGHRADTALMLSKQGPHKYTPHEDKVLQNVLAPRPKPGRATPKAALSATPNGTSAASIFSLIPILPTPKNWWKCSKKPISPA